MKRRATNLFQLSLTLALWSNIALSALTRSWSPPVDMSLRVQRLATLLLLILPAGIGIVLGVMSLRRKEWKPGWAISAVVLNSIGILAGIVHLSFP
jgi:hypothetical protein